MKKFIVFLMAIAITLSMCACSSVDVDSLEQFDPVAALEKIKTNIASAKVEYNDKQFKFSGNIVEISELGCDVSLCDGPKDDDHLTVSVKFPTEVVAELNEGFCIDFTGKVKIVSEYSITIEDPKLLEPEEIKNLSSDPNIIEFEDATFKFTGAFWNDQCLRLDSSRGWSPAIGLTITCEYTNKGANTSSAEDYIRVVAYQDGKKLNEKCWSQERHPDVDVSPRSSILPSATQVVGFAYNSNDNNYISNDFPVVVEVTDKYGRVLSNLEFTMEDYF